MSRWEYRLSPKEEGLCAEIGYHRQSVYFGQPERNRNYSEGDIWEMWQHSIAAGAELAAARMFGLTEFVPSVNTYRSELDIPGYEIRYSFTYQGTHSLRYRIDLDNPDSTYILIIGGPEHRAKRSAEDGYKAPAYRAVGFIKGDLVPHTGKQITELLYRVPSQELYPMELIGA